MSVPAATPKKIVGPDSRSSISLKADWTEYIRVTTVLMASSGKSDSRRWWAASDISSRFSAKRWCDVRSSARCCRKFGRHLRKTSTPQHLDELGVRRAWTIQPDPHDLQPAKILFSKNPTQYYTDYQLAEFHSQGLEKAGSREISWAPWNLELKSEIAYDAYK